MVGEGEGLVSQLPRPQNQLLDMGSAFEEGEVGVGVELGVGCHLWLAISLPRLGLS